MIFEILLYANTIFILTALLYNNNTLQMFLTYGADDIVVNHYFAYRDVVQDDK